MTYIKPEVASQKAKSPIQRDIHSGLNRQLHQKIARKMKNPTLTLYLFFRSEERAALIRIRLSLEGALKCAFLDLRLELLTPISTPPSTNTTLTTLATWWERQHPTTNAHRSLHFVRNVLCVHVELSTIPYTKSQTHTQTSSHFNQDSGSESSETYPQKPLNQLKSTSETTILHRFQCWKLQHRERRGVSLRGENFMAAGNGEDTQGRCKRATPGILSLHEATRELPREPFLRFRAMGFSIDLMDVRYYTRIPLFIHPTEMMHIDCIPCLRLRILYMYRTHNVLV